MFNNLLSISTKFGFRYFLPEINFQNLYSVLAINLFSLLSLKILFPINDIFLILALSPNSISKFILTRLLSKFSIVIPIFELKYPISFILLSSLFFSSSKVILLYGDFSLINFSKLISFNKVFDLMPL